jgi:hypothetical protein
MKTEMVLDALEMARASRGRHRLIGLVTHSDGGSQFTSVRFTEGWRRSVPVPVNIQPSYDMHQDLLQLLQRNPHLVQSLLRAERVRHLSSMGQLQKMPGRRWRLRPRWWRDRRTLPRPGPTEAPHPVLPATALGLDERGLGVAHLPRRPPPPAVSPARPEPSAGSPARSSQLPSSPCCSQSWRSSRCRPPTSPAEAETCTCIDPRRSTGQRKYANECRSDRPPQKEESP